jgi:hypothetical protein
MLKWKPSKIEKQFWAFHYANPQVYEKLRELAFQVKNSGQRRFGIRCLWERLRWWRMLETGGKDFKLNDHYHSHYARLLMSNEPTLHGLFELRSLKWSKSLRADFTKISRFG